MHKAAGQILWQHLTGGRGHVHSSHMSRIQVNILVKYNYNQCKLTLYKEVAGL